MDNVLKNQAILFVLCGIFLFGCEKSHKYLDFQTESDCKNMAYISKLHRYITHTVCANLDFPTNAFNYDSKKSLQLSMLCIRKKLSKIENEDEIRHYLLYCANRHGDEDANDVVTYLIQQIN